MDGISLKISVILIEKHFIQNIFKIVNKPKFEEINIKFFFYFNIVIVSKHNRRYFLLFILNFVFQRIRVN